MQRKWYRLLLAFVFLLGLTACGSDEALFQKPELPGKIAIITDEWNWNGSYTSAVSLVEKYGAENVIHLTWSGWRDSEMLSFVELIAQDPEIKVLIINPACFETDQIVSLLREQRKDIFIIYVEYAILIDSDDFTNSVSMANLILNANMHEVNRTIPMQAQKLGTETIISFSIDPNSYSYPYGFYDSLEEYHMMRAISEEIGLNFVEVFRGEYEIQCGSSLSGYIERTLPGLIEKYGNDIVLVGLCSERLLWYSLSQGLIYPSSQTFLPSPYFIAQNLSIPALIEMEREEFFRKDNLAFIIGETRKELEERNLLGRISTWPVSTCYMFAYVAVKYSIMWMNNEVPQEGIDIEVIEQIMVDFIAESTGEYEWGVGLVPLSHNSIVYPNYLLVFLDFMTY